VGRGNVAARATPPLREIGKEEPQTKPNSHPLGCHKDRSRSIPICLGFPTGRVASNQTTCRQPSWCFVLGFLFLCADVKCWANVISFLISVFQFAVIVKRGPASRNDCRVLAAHTDGNGTPLHLSAPYFETDSPTTHDSGIIFSFTTAAVDGKRCV
jgi:hypothetical protein